jgi:transglutaminase-like putative cysteine protease
VLVNTRGPLLARRAVGLIAAVAIILALASLLPYLSSGTELARARNALTYNVATAESFAWTPAAWPADFLRDEGPPDPYFAAAVRSLNLEALPTDWDRAVAIAAHLLGSQPKLTGGPIQSDLRDTHRRIVERGEGYCADFVRVFQAMAGAAGVPVRAWAFSFDGFGGHGHVWPEIWNRQVGAWQLLDVFDNYRFVDDGRTLSALQLREALLAWSRVPA